MTKDFVRVGENTYQNKRLANYKVVLHFNRGKVRLKRGRKCFRIYNLYELRRLKGIDLIVALTSPDEKLRQVAQDLKAIFNEYNAECK